MDEKTINEKCKEILASNLDEDLKIELIALLKGGAQTIYVPWNPVPNPSPTYPPYNQPWWERVTCGNSGCRPWGDGYQPTKQEWENAQADNVMNSQVSYRNRG